MPTVRRRPPGRRAIPSAVRSVAVVLVVVIGVVACGDVRDQANAPFRPAQEGYLTVATELPAPGFWDPGSGT